MCMYIYIYIYIYIPFQVADMYQLEESEVYKHHLVSLVQKEKVHRWKIDLS